MTKEDQKTNQLEQEWRFIIKERPNPADRMIEKQGEKQGEKQDFRGSKLGEIISILRW